MSAMYIRRYDKKQSNIKKEKPGYVCSCGDMRSGLSKEFSSVAASALSTMTRPVCYTLKNKG